MRSNCKHARSHGPRGNGRLAALRGARPRSGRRARSHANCGELSRVERGNEILRRHFFGGLLLRNFVISKCRGQTGDVIGTGGDGEGRAL